ncbi:DMT family transporter [Algivirga pacifica]|uniref:DMT family transporter n=1 Tax=Algivirga pacifica TaxID=1162670 RepID=A0ABP9DM45_9BACT
MIKQHLKLHFIVFIWGFTAILGKEISVEATELVFYRTAIAAIGLGAIMLARGKSLKMPPKAALKVTLTGFIVGFHWITFFAAAKLSVSVCLAGIATTSLFTAIMEPLSKKQKINPLEITLGLMVIVGLYVIFKFEVDHLTALTIALVSAGLSALFSVINSHFTHKYEATHITFYEMIGGALCCLLMMPIFNHYFGTGDQVLFHALSMMDIVYLVILSLVCTVYAFYVSIEIMRYLTAFYVNLTINMEPIYGIIMAAILYKEHEQMSSGFYTGTLIILMAVALYPVLKRVFKRKPIATVNR